MEHLILFEYYSLNESMVTRAKPGDIVQSSQRGKYLILSEPRIGRAWNEYDVMHISDIEKVLKDPKLASATTWKIRQGAYLDVVGTVPKAKMLKLKEAYDKKYVEISTHNAEFTANKYKKNSPAINWQSRSSRYGDGEYVVTMADGNIAKVGDTVAVKFSNGVFNGVIKTVAGKENAQVGIVFRGKTKARGIDPEKILRKA